MFCKICGSLNTTKIFDAANIHGRHILDGSVKFEIYRCQGCSVVFVAGVVVDKEYLFKYYPPDYYASGVKGRILNHILRLYGKMVMAFKESEILRYVRPGNNSKLKILDIGCGSGEFLANISPKIFDKYGQEINPHGQEECRHKDIAVISEELKDAGQKADFFDVITMWHVLEHLDNPTRLLSEAHRILKSGGILIVATPNTDSLGFKFGRCNWFHLDSPRHLILYNRKSLTLILSKAGFKIERFKNMFYDFPLDLFWSLRDSRLKYFFYLFYPFFKIISGETILLAARKAGVYVGE